MYFFFLNILFIENFSLLFFISFSFSFSIYLQTYIHTSTIYIFIYFHHMYKTKKNLFFLMKYNIYFFSIFRICYYFLFINLFLSVLRNKHIQRNLALRFTSFLFWWKKYERKIFFLSLLYNIFVLYNNKTKFENP